jgi:hypothetical protein
VVGSPYFTLGPFPEPPLLKERYALLCTSACGSSPEDSVRRDPAEPLCSQTYSPKCLEVEYSKVRNDKQGQISLIRRMRSARAARRCCYEAHHRILLKIRDKWDR